MKNRWQIFGINTDITGHRQVAEAIANEGRLLRTLIDLLPETFYVKAQFATKNLHEFFLRKFRIKAILNASERRIAL